MLLFLWLGILELQDSDEGYLLVEFEGINIFVVELHDAGELLVLVIVLLLWLGWSNLSALKDLAHPLIQIGSRDAKHIASILNISLVMANVWTTFILA